MTKKKMKSAAHSVASEAMKRLAGDHNNISISTLNYGVAPTSEFMAELRAMLPNDWTSTTDGFMGYVQIRKPVAAATK